MDSQLAALDRRAAEAATAWLADPRDAGVYGRLVTAIEARTAYLHPRLDPDDQLPDDAPATERPAAAGEDELLDELADERPVRPVGVDLHGEPAAVLMRLQDGVRPPVGS